MKTKLFITTVIVMLGFNVFSQGWQNITPEERAKKMTEQMKYTLDLSDDQADKVYTVQLKYATKHAEMRSAAQEKQASKQTMASELRDKHNEELKTVLTEEQFTKHMKAKYDRSAKAPMGKGTKGQGNQNCSKGYNPGPNGQHAQRGQHGNPGNKAGAQHKGNHMPADIPAEVAADNQTLQMETNLLLSEEQLKKVKAINLKYAKLREEERKASKTERDQHLIEANKLRNSQREEIKQILTPEQFIKWEQTVRQGRGQGPGNGPGRPM